MLGTLPDGEQGTRATLKVMVNLVRQYRKSIRIRDLALDLVRPLASRDWPGEVSAVFNWVRDNIRYTRDIRNVETVQTPEVTLEVEQGDCDDKSVLLASLLESIGHPTRFIAVGFKQAGAYSHVLVQTRIGPRWIPLDPIMPFDAGWSPPGPRAVMIAHV